MAGIWKGTKQTYIDEAIKNIKNVPAVGKYNIVSDICPTTQCKSKTLFSKDKRRTMTVMIEE